MTGACQANKRGEGTAPLQEEDWFPSVAAAAPADSALLQPLNLQKQTGWV